MARRFGSGVAGLLKGLMWIQCEGATGSLGKACRDTGPILRFKNGILAGISGAQGASGTALEEQARSVLEDWAFSESMLVFTEGETGEASAGDAGRLNAGDLILDVIRRDADPRWVRRQLSAASGNVSMAPSLPKVQPRVAMTPTDAFLLSRADGSMTLEEIVKVSPMEAREVTCSLYALVLAGLLSAPGARLPGEAREAGTGAGAPRAAPAEGPGRPREAAFAAESSPTSPRGTQPGAEELLPAGPPERGASGAPGAAAGSPAGLEPRKNTPAPEMAAGPEPPKNTPAPEMAAGPEPPKNTPAPEMAPVPEPPRNTPAPEMAAGPEPPQKPPAPGRPRGPVTPQETLPGRKPAAGVSALDDFLARTSKAAAPQEAPPPHGRARPAEAPSPEMDKLRQEVLDWISRSAGSDYYGILGIDRSADEGAIRRAYYSLAKRFHPDRFRRPGFEGLLEDVERMFAATTAAYNTLTDETTRAEYEKDAAAKARAGGGKEAGLAAQARESYLRARKHIEAEEFFDAASLLESACAMDGSKPEYWLALGSVQEKNPKWRRKAEASYQKVIEIDPTSADAYLHLARLYKAGGLSRRSMEMYKKVLEWDPDHEEALAGASGRDDSQGAGVKDRIRSIFKGTKS